MSILDDVALFATVIQQGGFSHAAKQLGLSNGLISRRIKKLEAELAVTLIKRTTRQLHITPEGELLLQHAQRIQQELDAALVLIQSSAKKPKGTIRLSAPLYFGSHYLAPIILKFLNNFNNIKVELFLSNKKLDPIKEGLDIVIRGAGYIESTHLKDSSLQAKLLLREKIGLYASPEYLLKNGLPQNLESLQNHKCINYINNKHLATQEKWTYNYKNKHGHVELKSNFSSNDIESSLTACVLGQGIGRFTTLNVKNAIAQQQLYPILQQYDWGSYNLYAMYSHQEAMPKRTRLLLDFIYAHIHNILDTNMD